MEVHQGTVTTIGASILETVIDNQCPMQIELLIIGGLFSLSLSLTLPSSPPPLSLSRPIKLATIVNELCFFIRK